MPVPSLKSCLGNVIIMNLQLVILRPKIILERLIDPAAHQKNHFVRMRIHTIDFNIIKLLEVYKHM